MINRTKSWGKTFKCHSFDLELPQVIKIKKKNNKKQQHKKVKLMIVLQFIWIV